MTAVRTTLGLGCILWTVVSLALTSNVGLSLEAALILMYGAVIISVIWLTMMIAGRVAKTRVPRPWLEPIAVVAVLTMVYADVPFYARFFASKPFLERYVKAAPNDGPRRWVGLFHARETQVLGDGYVRIITTSCMFDDCGLAFRSTGAPTVIGEDSYERIATNWWRWQRSW